MECEKCGKEISLDDGVVYCPYCGVKARREEGRESVVTKKVGANYIEVVLLIAWIALCGFLVVFVNMNTVVIGALLGLEIPELSNWMVTCVLAGIVLYIVVPYAVYNHAKRHHRRAVAWTTACIAFTPILGGISYLLTWPAFWEKS